MAKLRELAKEFGYDQPSPTPKTSNGIVSTIGLPITDWLVAIDLTISSVGSQ